MSTEGSVEWLLIRLLRNKGYHGLYHEDCACLFDDFAPCGSEYGECMPGYKHNCPDDCDDCKEQENCDLDRDFSTWYINGNKDA